MGRSLSRGGPAPSAARPALTAPSFHVTMTDMKSRKVTSKPRRAYSSPLRDGQAEATRRLIVEGLIEQLADGGLPEFSLPRVAKRAGVTTRTIYRHFPTREALLAAVDAEMEARVGSNFDVADADAIVASVRPQFEMFDAHATLIKALLQAGVGGEIRARGRQRRAARLRAVLAAAHPGMSAAELSRATALVHLIFSAGSWEALQQVWGLSSEEAATTVEWGVQTILAELRRRHASPVPKKKQPKKVARRRR